MCQLPWTELEEAPNKVPPVFLDQKGKSDAKAFKSQLMKVVTVKTQIGTMQLSVARSSLVKVASARFSSRETWHQSWRASLTLLCTFLFDFMSRAFFLHRIENPAQEEPSNQPSQSN